MLKKRTFQLESIVLYHFCQYFYSRRFLLRLFQVSQFLSLVFALMEGAPFCGQHVGVPCPYASRQGEWVNTQVTYRSDDYRPTLASKGNEIRCDEKWKQLVFFFLNFFWFENMPIANQMIFQVVVAAAVVVVVVVVIVVLVFLFCCDFFGIDPFHA